MMKKIYIFFWWLWNFPEIVWLKIKTKLKNGQKMDKQRYNQIIDEVYNKYLTRYMGYEDVPSKELFLFEIKNNTEFSERWGLKIEERGLSENERYKIFDERGYEFRMNNWSKEEQYDKANIPTKQITLEYNGTKIEIYE